LLITIQGSLEGFHCRNLTQVITYNPLNSAILKVIFSSSEFSSLASSDWGIIYLPENISLNPKRLAKKLLAAS
jgi:hypothetical protein